MKDCCEVRSDVPAGQRRVLHVVLSINAASAALMISGIPFEGPIGAVRIAFSQEGEWIPHPTYEESEASTFELVVASARRLHQQMTGTREDTHGEIGVFAGYQCFGKSRYDGGHRCLRIQGPEHASCGFRAGAPVEAPETKPEIIEGPVVAHD